MGAGPQLRTRGRGGRREGRVLTHHPAITESRLGKVALALVVPALLLPALAGAALIITQDNGSGVERGVGGIVLLVYLFVLLGSMTLNAWLLLRHPHTLTRRALPRSPSVVLVSLWAILIVWAVVLASPIPAEVGDWLSLLFALGAIVLSIIGFFLAVGRRVDDADRQPLGRVELSDRVRVVLWVFLVAAALALLSYTGLSVMGGVYAQTGGILGGPASWVLIMLGLPWSHPLHFLSVVGALTLFSGAGAGATVIATIVPVVGVGINVVLACLLLFSPARRTRLVNWFFRLRSKPARTPVPVPPQ